MEIDLLNGVNVRSTNSTPVAGSSTAVNPSRKSPQGDAQNYNAKDENRSSSRVSGGQARSISNDQRNNQQRGGGGGGNSGASGRSAGGRGGRARGGRGGASGGQGSFNRFAGSFANRSKGPLKFDEDYDFESANVKVITYKL